MCVSVSIYFFSLELIWNSMEFIIKWWKLGTEDHSTKIFILGTLLIVFGTRCIELFFIHHIKLLKALLKFITLL